MFPEGKQILLVDDPADAQGVGSVLRSMGQQVTAVSDATRALETAMREGFDMAPVGIGLAGDGPAGLVGRLRAVTRIPSILILADRDQVDRAFRALAHGADD